MKMLYGEIDNFISFLLSFDLDHKQSRKRGQLIKLLNEKKQYLHDGYLALVNDFAERDESGQYKKQRINENEEEFVLCDKVAFQREYISLLHEEFDLDNTNERRDFLLLIRNLILDPPDERKFSGADAMRYERWCEIAETIEYEEKE